MIQHYSDFDVYKRSYALAVQMYEASRPFPKEERYGLTSQIQRAAVSIPLNIAEGYGKQESAAEFKRYLRMAKGSCCEIEVLLNLAKDLGYMTNERSEALQKEYEVVRKMLYRLEEKWR